jgi:hypothetical protein
MCRARMSQEATWPRYRRRSRRASPQWRRCWPNLGFCPWAFAVPYAFRWPEAAATIYNRHAQFTASFVSLRIGRRACDGGRIERRLETGGGRSRSRSAGRPRCVPVTVGAAAPAVPNEVTLQQAHRTHPAAQLSDVPSADGVAPMSLVTYEEVRPWARSIKAAHRLGPKARGVMPPVVRSRRTSASALQGRSLAERSRESR